MGSRPRSTRWSTTPSPPGRVSGSRTNRSSSTLLAAGVPLDGETCQQINQAAADLGLDDATAEKLAAACIVTAPKL